MNSKAFWRSAMPALIILVCGAVLVTLVIVLKPKPEPRPEPEPPLPVVNVVHARAQTLALPVHSQGTVAPRRQIELVSQVGGRVVEVAPQFVGGGFFAADEWLVQVDGRDYEFALTRAQARLSEAERVVASERGLALQAEREWRDLGNPDANALFLRKPQQVAAEASLAAARADRDQARLDLERTRIAAPFAGRIRSTHVDLGQHVSPGTPVATVFDSAAVEVRLPLTDLQAALLDLPLLGNPQDTQPKVTLSGMIAGERHQWQGRITRTEASVDTQSRLYFALAEVRDPFDLEQHTAPLLVGVYVSAEIEGRSLREIIELPVTAVFRRDQIYTLDSENKIQQKTVRVMHRDDERVWVRGDLAEGEAVIVDRQGYVSPGVAVNIAEQDVESANQSAYKEAP